MRTQPYGYNYQGYYDAVADVERRAEHRCECHGLCGQTHHKPNGCRSKRRKQVIQLDGNPRNLALANMIVMCGECLAFLRAKQAAQVREWSTHQPVVKGLTFDV
jgi:hypothetical protein